MASRGIPPHHAQAYLNPTYTALEDPFHLPGLRTAVQRLARALERGETILIHGDYDVDGVTALALLYRNLKDLGAEKVLPYIPDRFEEGYGVSLKGIQQAVEQGATLVVTVDCGMKAHEEIRYALEHGLDVLVTDHHEPGDPLPFPTMVVNPKLAESGTPELSGVGVVFKILQGLYRHLGRKETPLMWDLDLVALGTIADLVPLQGENRILAALGLQVLERTKKSGLKALKKVAGLQRGPLQAWHVSFILAPRLNAAGRLSHAQKAFQLLITPDGQEALKLAQELDQENRSRQKIEEMTLQEALEQIEAEGWQEDPLLVLASEGWHEGVIGIVASRIVERYWRPTLMMTIHGDVAKGSARSIPGFPLYQALSQFEDLFLSFGGHAMAAGFRLRTENIPKLRTALRDLAQTWLTEEDLSPKLWIDVTVDLQALSTVDIQEFYKLGPFGPENPTPTFLLKDVEIVGEIRKIKEDHIAFRVRQGPHHLKVFAPRKGELYDLLKQGGIPKADLVVTLEEDPFSVHQKVKLKVRDLRIHPAP